MAAPSASVVIVGVVVWAWAPRGAKVKKVKIIKAIREIRITPTFRATGYRLFRKKKSPAAFEARLFRRTTKLELVAQVRFSRRKNRGSASRREENASAR